MEEEEDQEGSNTATSTAGDLPPSANDTSPSNPLRLIAPALAAALNSARLPKREPPVSSPEELSSKPERKRRKGRGSRGKRAGKKLLGTIRLKIR